MSRRRCGSNLRPAAQPAAAQPPTHAGAGGLLSLAAGCISRGRTAAICKAASFKDGCGGTRCRCCGRAHLAQRVGMAVVHHVEASVHIDAHGAHACSPGHGHGHGQGGEQCSHRAFTVPAGKAGLPLRGRCGRAGSGCASGAGMHAGPERRTASQLSTAGRAAGSSARAGAARAHARRHSAQLPTERSRRRCFEYLFSALASHPLSVPGR
jgi:hypothetical protein